MAYLDTQAVPTRDKVAALGATGLVNLGIGTALILGLATEITLPPILPNPTATQIPIEPLPTPKPTEQVKEADKDKEAISEITTVKRELEFEIDRPIKRPVSEEAEDVNPKTGGTEKEQAKKKQEPKPLPTETPTPPAPTPLFTPKPPMPINSSRSWVTTRDYPAIELRRGSEGTSRFMLHVDQRGRVTDCQITQSSGFARLDKTACSKVKRRARFEPATDDTGSAIGGKYSSAVRWQIPK